MQIQFITKDDCYELRHRVLRPHQPLSECKYNCDESPETFHVGVKLNHQLITISTFAHEDPPESLALMTEEFANERLISYRLRGMATDINFRRQNSGALALAYALVELQHRHAQLLWFNAREAAFPFYEKLGFQFHGEMFDMPGIGEHKVMYKLLNTR